MWGERELILPHPPTPPTPPTPLDFSLVRNPGVRGQYGYKVQCKDVKVYLISQEYIEEPATSTKPGEINLGSPKKPIFKYQGIVKSDNTKYNSGSTTYCKYSVLPKAKSVGKKAILVFDSGSTCPGPNEIITILDTIVQKNSKQFICSIG
ncbi:MAG: hypothetical protein RMY28_029565 [Nostoc sp. ChiSLP01]|nr:hypothetical protein [Nostoc sp. CmiSLP01]